MSSKDGAWYLCHQHTLTLSKTEFLRAVCMPAYILLFPLVGVLMSLFDKIHLEGYFRLP